MLNMFKRKWFCLVFVVVVNIYGTAVLLFHVTFEIDFFLLLFKDCNEYIKAI